MANLTPIGCRAARAILQWSVRDLAEAAGVSKTTVNQLERGRPFRQDTAERIIATFAEHGVEVLNGDAPGARKMPGR